MRILFIFLSFALVGCVAVSSVPRTEVDQIREAEQFVRLSLTERLLGDLQQRNQDRLNSLLIAKGIPAEDVDRLLDEEFTGLVATEEQLLLDALVPIYRRYYTAAELHQLLSFYQTDVARKSLKVSGQIAADGQQYVRLWHEHFEEKLLEMVDKRLAAEGVSID